jgi:hypothetical protein
VIVGKLYIVLVSCITFLIVHHVIFCLLMVKLIHLWHLFSLDYIICCVGTPQGLALYWFVINVQKVDIWDVLWDH